MTDFTDGLKTNRLHPPTVIVFFQGLARRFDESARGLEQAGGPPSESDNALRELVDQLTRTVIELKNTGYGPEHEVENYASPALLEDPELSQLNAAALEVARRIAGVPDQAWTDNPDLLTQVRQCCADAAATVQDLRAKTEVARESS